MPGPAHYMQPAMKLAEIRALLVSVPAETLSALIHQAIENSDCAYYLRNQLASVSLHDEYGLFYAIDMLQKYTDVVALLRK